MVDVIILAAGNIKNKLHFANFHFDSPALIPINVRSSISYTLDFYNNCNVNIHLVVNDKDKIIVEQEIQYYKNVNIISVETSKSVIETLSFALKQIKIDNDVIINISTTIPTLFPESNSVLIDNICNENADWSAVVFDEKNNVSFVYKNNLTKKISNAFTGIFRCSKDILNRTLEKVHNENDLLSLIEKINDETKLAFIQTNWIDCGHELNFYDAKAKLISSRSFNAIEIRPIEGIVKKSSKNIDKFLDEIEYIEQLPKDIKVFYPSILNEVQIIDNKASVEMEYYGYHTLAEYMLYWNIKHYTWEKIFHSLTYVIKKFQSYKYSIGRKAYYDFNYVKTKNRIEKFKSQFGHNNSLFNDIITINGTKYNGVDALNDKIVSKINSLYNEDDFFIMHGDLCFNNILFDIKSNIIRLIDARGSYGDSCKGIYGDIKYDLAKLTHSIIGCYDFIVNNLFSTTCDQNGFHYEIVKRANYDILYKFNIELIENLGIKKNDILFLVGLLFISMCPLHDDDKNRQQVMYLHGLKYINENLE